MKFLAILCFLLVFCCPPPGYTDLRKGDKPNYPHIFRGSKPYQSIYRGNKKLWENTNPPVIAIFRATPGTIDFDTHPTGSISFTISVTGRSGQTTNAHIVKLPEGSPVGPSYSGANGGNINQTLPNIGQPQQTTTYRLIAMNTGGSSHKDTTVTVTKNPTLTNCRRISFTHQAFQYVFGFTVTGLPRPTVTYSFSGGQTGTIVSNLFRAGPNPYTWTINNFRLDMPNANAQSLTLTATNGSGSTTCTLSNIND